MMKKLISSDFMAFATLGLFLGAPAFVSALGFVRLLNGDWGGLLALGLPAMLVWLAYETHSHWSGVATEIKWVAASWAAGLPAGLAIWTLLKGFQALFA